MRIKEVFPRLTGRSALPRVARLFAKGRNGSVSIEMALSSVLFVTLVTGLIGFGSLFFIQGNMGDAARDAVRRIATGELTEAEAETYAQGKLINWGMTYTVDADIDGPDATVDITVPMSDAALIDFLGIFTGTLSASVTMPVEIIRNR